MLHHSPKSESESFNDGPKGVQSKALTSCETLGYTRSRLTFIKTSEVDEKTEPQVQWGKGQSRDRNSSFLTSQRALFTLTLLLFPNH